MKTLGTIWPNVVMQLTLLVLSLTLVLSPRQCQAFPIEENDIAVATVDDDLKQVTMEDDKTTANPVKSWFDELSKNMTSNSQNAIKDLQQWFSGLSGNSQSNNPFSTILGGANNSPMMILGSYQALKIPMPGLDDVMKGMTNLAGAANNVNQLFSKIPKLPGQ